MSNQIISKIVGVLFAGAVCACTPGAATDSLVETPDVPDGDKCDAATIGGVISPYVLEWPTSTRGDLEAAMAGNVVVVSYSCDGVKVLPDCKVEGDYGYLALTPKTESNLIEGADNIRASFGGASFGVDAKLERGAKLDMSYMLVGKRSTQRSTVTKADLVGDDFCAGATHFVKRADVGAWTMVTGKSVSAGLAAQVMNQGVGAESSNKEVRSKADGDPKTCKGAKKGDADAPDGCGALILVSLAPIKGGDAKIADIKTTGVDDTFECPAGRVKAEGGGCVTKAAATGAYLCDASNTDECLAQCKAGSDGSCGRLANQVIYVQGETGDDAQMKKAIGMFKPLAERFRTACENDQAPACMASVFIMLPELANIESAPQAERVAKLNTIAKFMERGCAAGDPKACSFFRLVFVDGREKLKEAGIDTMANYKRALEIGCRGGQAAPCAYLAFEQTMGTVIKQDVQAAQRNAHKACLGDSADACLLASALASDADTCSEDIGKLGKEAGQAFSASEVCAEEILSEAKADGGAAKKTRERACKMIDC